MGIENPTPNTERGPRVHSQEEIRYQMRRFIEKFGQQNLHEERIFAEGEKIYLYEFSATDEKGDAYLYLYKRKGDHAKASAATTVLEVTYYVGRLEDGMCVGGDTLSNYDETTNQWVDVQ
jgi:hypothetical protein